MKKYITPVITSRDIKITLLSHSNGHCSNCKWGDSDNDGKDEEFWHCDHSTGWGGNGKFYPDCDY